MHGRLWHVHRPPACSMAMADCGLHCTALPWWQHTANPKRARSRRGRQFPVSPPSPPGLKKDAAFRATARSANAASMMSAPLAVAAPGLGVGALPAASAFTGIKGTPARSMIPFSPPHGMSVAILVDCPFPLRSAPLHIASIQCPGIMHGRGSQASMRLEHAECI